MKRNGFSKTDLASLVGLIVLAYAYLVPRLIP
jgi:hypothetical protein